MAPHTGGSNCAATSGKEWNRAHLTALQAALAAFRPSISGFWQRVADRVGRPVEQCFAQAEADPEAEAEVEAERPAPKRGRPKGAADTKARVRRIAAQVSQDRVAASPAKVDALRPAEAPEVAGVPDEMPPSTLVAPECTTSSTRQAPVAPDMPCVLTNCDDHRAKGGECDSCGEHHNKGARTKRCGICCKLYCPRCARLEPRCAVAGQQAFPAHTAQSEAGAEDATRQPPPSKRRRCQDGEGDGSKENSPPSSPGAPLLPRSHGPRRARRIRDFLAQHSKCDGHDFFDLRAGGQGGMQQDLQEDPLLSSIDRAALGGVSISRPMLRLREEECGMADPVNDLELQLCDHTFQPKGLDSFICRMQALPSGRRAASEARLDSTSCRVAKRPRLREFFRAEALFRKLDQPAGMGIGQDIFEDGPEFGEDEDSDDAAPLAFIPCTAVRAEL